MEYKVIWEIEIEADNEKEAAIKARQIQQDPESTATIFKVKPYESNEDFKSIDASEYICPNCGAESDYSNAFDGYNDGDYYVEIECDKCNITWEAHYERSTRFLNIDNIETK